MSERSRSLRKVLEVILGASAVVALIGFMAWFVFYGQYPRLESGKMFELRGQLHAELATNRNGDKILAGEERCILQPGSKALILGSRKFIALLRIFHAGDSANPHSCPADVLVTVSALMLESELASAKLEKKRAEERKALIQEFAPR